MNFNYDIIVVGAGHAGCEAATAAANLGSKTLLITMDMNKIAQMSCNPAVGGIAKGQIVRDLLRHPYLNYNQVQTIFNLRDKKGRISSIEELSLLDEFTDDDIERLRPYLQFL
jgi:tRNA U34 5-carboxymethylaminomethyl modifying enzyme MnmG/GidA